MWKKHYKKAMSNYINKYIDIAYLIVNSYLTDDGSEDKQAKDTKMCAIKRKLKFENYKNCLQATQFEKNIQKNIKLMQIVLKKS